MLGTGDKWKPSVHLVDVMKMIRLLMVEPNLDSPMNGDAAKDYQNGTWEQKAR